MKTFRNVSPDWGDFTEVTPADYRKQAEIFGVDVKVTSDNEGIYINGLLVAEPIKETQRETHTPPKWHVEHPYGEPGTYVTDDTTALIAKVYPKAYPSANLTAEDRGLQEERAALIAAAPELLEACQELVKHIETLPDDTEKCRTLKLALNNRARDMIRKAIEKATGVYPL